MAAWTAEMPSAMILAGGLGTRLRMVVPDRPKALVRVAGRPFLSYQLDRLAAAGVTMAVVCTGYRGGQIRRAFGSTYGALRLRYAQEPAPLGTAGALRFALPRIDGEAVLAMNGDAFWDVDLQAFWRWHLRRGAAASIALARVAETSRYGRVRMDRKSRVRAFEEKSAKGPGWINIGVYLLSRKMLARIPSGRAVSIEREVFPRWVGRGLYGYRSRGRFLDIGTPESYRMAERFVREPR